MHYHPRIHYLAPGDAFCSTSDHSWHSSPEAFDLPVRILSAKIKSRFFKLIRKAGLQHLLPWNVNSQSVGYVSSQKPAGNPSALPSQSSHTLLILTKNLVFVAFMIYAFTISQRENSW